MPLSLAEAAKMSAREYALLVNTERRERNRPDSFSLLMPVDEAYWAEQAGHGIKTGADVIRRDAIQTYSDVYKDIHGIRPRWVDFESMTTKEIEDMLLHLMREES